MSCILPPTEEYGGLYLGNIEAAQDINLLRACNIRAVLTVAKDTELRYNDVNAKLMLNLFFVLFSQF
jgi:hypothetical protein